MKKIELEKILEEAGFEGMELRVMSSAFSKDIDADVFDPHYGSKINTDLALLRKENGDHYLVGFDRTNNIIEVEFNNGELRFDNTNSFGSLVDGKLNGWCFDREGTIIYGYESTGYYKENKAS